MYPESYWEPLVVLNNATVKVEEGSRVTIDQAALNIMHPNIAPSDITYMIVQRPHHGFLEVDLGQTSTSDYEHEASLLKPEVCLCKQDNFNSILQVYSVLAIVWVCKVLFAHIYREIAI